jgi:hypothetical protein
MGLAAGRGGPDYGEDALRTSPSRGRQKIDDGEAARKGNGNAERRQS